MINAVLVISQGENDGLFIDFQGYGYYTYTLNYGTGHELKTMHRLLAGFCITIFSKKEKV